MAEQVFAFILHKDGKADDSALELVAAAKKIFPDTPPIAIVTGAGAALDAVCQETAASYKEVWKFANQILAYPNAEIIQPLLLKVLPKGGVLLLRRTPSEWIWGRGCPSRWMRLMCRTRWRSTAWTVRPSKWCVRNSTARSAPTWPATFPRAR